ncbi:MAG: hypothetical protein BECKG1743F_GA0114225_100618 [Candidatus Kentron sp. G]|nr:MAG: hypothetical protein BECKG1743F_GA0114225_100618 [Candidatus Kentron sp. G]
MPRTARLSFSVLLSGRFLFFLYAFYAAIFIRYWFAIDIAIRYRYRSYPAFSIASSDIDSDPERTNDTRCGLAALGPLRCSDKPRKRKAELQFALPQVENAHLLTAIRAPAKNYSHSMVAGGFPEIS